VTKRIRLKKRGQLGPSEAFPELKLEKNRGVNKKQGQFRKYTKRQKGNRKREAESTGKKKCKEGWAINRPEKGNNSTSRYQQTMTGRYKGKMKV